MKQEFRSVHSRRLTSRLLLTALVAVTFTGCGQTAESADTPEELAAAFLANLSELCGQAFAGVVLKGPDTDPAFNPGDPMVLHIRECGPSEVRTPVWMMAVDDRTPPRPNNDASRTFVFTTTPVGLDVRHDHRHSDGRMEPNSLYGGTAANPPIATEPMSATRMEFKRMTDEGSSTGWIAEILPGRFIYGTQTDGEWRHHFEFDLTTPVPVPGDPWGNPPLGTVASLPDAQEAFWSNLAQHCGQAFAGQLTRLPDGSDRFTGDEELIVHFRECEDHRLKLPFHVDDDRSRTWVFLRTTAGMDLRHDHRLESGAPDPQPRSTWYGAPTWEDGTPNRQEFLREDLSDGVRTGWRVEIIPGERYTYGTIRDGEWNFRADFDLTTPVEAPPTPWGH